MVHERILPIMHTNNFRDLGGYQTVDGQTVKWGQIFRADKLDRLSKEDQARLVQLKISVDLDLRSKDETTVSPDRLPDQVNYIFNPVFSEDLTDSSKEAVNLDEALQTEPLAGQKHMQEVYQQMMASDASAKAFRKIFEQLLTTNANQGVLFHCTAGKDRTGMSAYLILRALGVDEQTAKEDYLLTNEALKNFLNGQQAMLKAADQSSTLIDNYTALWSADLSYLNAALATVKDHYHDLHRYLSEAVGLSQGELTDLRKLYLE